LGGFEEGNERDGGCLSGIKVVSQRDKMDCIKDRERKEIRKSRETKSSI